MLKKIKNHFRKQKISKLKVIPGESVRDAMIKAGIKAIKESGYVADNIIEKLVNIATQSSQIIDRVTELSVGSEAASALGKIVFKTTKDIAGGDVVCTGCCIVSGTCETVALCCSTIKIIPFHGRIYVGAKIISKGCMSFRNACTGEGYYSFTE